MIKTNHAFMIKTNQAFIIKTNQPFFFIKNNQAFISYAYYLIITMSPLSAKRTYQREDIRPFVSIGKATQFLA